MSCEPLSIRCGTPLIIHQTSSQNIPNFDPEIWTLTLQIDKFFSLSQPISSQVFKNNAFVLHKLLCSGVLCNDDGGKLQISRISARKQRHAICPPYHGFTKSFPTQLWFLLCHAMLHVQGVCANEPCKNDIFDDRNVFVRWVFRKLEKKQ